VSLRRRRSAALIALAGATVTVAAVRAGVTHRGRGAVHYDGPPIAHTGGFGEPTCRVCHQGQPLNAAGGTLRVEGLPGRYEPGRTYELVVVLRRDGMGRAGFELSARAVAGAQAGALEATDMRVRVVPDSVTAVRYAEQTREGCSVTGPEARWTVHWRAPAQTGEGGGSGGGSSDVLIHVAANAANYDDSPLGDFIYAGEWRVGGPAAASH